MNRPAKELTVKTLKGDLQKARESSETIWTRFDRLQRSLSPLRAGKRLSRGLHYGYLNAGDEV
jgi:hypothetical protein